MKLSNKRETFCQLVALQGMNPTQAYREAYNVTSDRKRTSTENASRLMKDSNIEQRISNLKDTVIDRIVTDTAWTKERFITEAENNLNQSRELNQMNPANTSLQLIGRVTGILEDKPNNQINIGIVETLGRLPDSVLQQLESMTGTEETIEPIGTIETSFKVLESEPE
jgi:hypothetical protein